MTEEEQIAQAFADDERAIAGAFGAPPPGSDEHEIAAAFGDGEIRNAPATWGDVFSSAGKMSLPGQILSLLSDAKGALVDGEVPSAEHQRSPLGVLSPQEREGFFGTVVPTYAAAGGLLAGGPAGVGLGPLAAREAIGLGSGAATRSMIAAGRGQDPLEAAADPTGIAIDAGMAAIPEVLYGGKTAAQWGWSKLPTSVTAPVHDVASSAAHYVGDKASGAVSRAANWLASRKPGYGEQLIEDRPVEIADIMGGSRPDFRTDLATERLGGPSSAPRTVTDRWLEKTRGQISLLRSLGRDDLADSVELANNIERRLTNHFGPMTDETVLPLTQGPAESASSVPLSTRVVDVVEGGHPLTGEGQGAQAARFADMLRRPDVYDPEIQLHADAMRREMSQLGEAGQLADVYDELKGAGSRARAMELQDQGVAVAPIGGTDDDPARWFAQRQLVGDGRYYPHQPMPDPLAPDISEAVGIERIMTANPELSYQQAQRQLGALRASAATGKARLAEEGVEYNKYAPDVIPGHVRADITRIANAAAFGGKPVKIKVSAGNGGQEILVGEKAAAQLADLANRGDWRVYNAYESALAARHMPPPKDPDLAKLLSATARMALPRAFLTQIGQLPTGAIMHGGVSGMARGLADVEANPVLRDIFRIGAQSHEFTDYAARVAGVAAEQNAAPFMRPAETFLRGPASYVAVPMVKDVAKEAAAMLEANQPFSRALVKKAAEMGTTPDALGAEYISTNGVLSHATWLDTIQKLTNRWQHVQGVGEIPAWARTQAGAAGAQFKLFGIKQSQLIYDDIIQPLLEGIRTGDKSLRDLGAARAGRLLYMGMPANAIAGALRSLASGRMPRGAAILRQAVTGPTGVAGDVGYAVADSVSGHRYGDDEFRTVREVPALSVPIDTLRDLLAVGDSPGGAAEAAARMGGMYDPRIPLYATPAINVTREFFSSK